jgi:hypothetical protein
VSTHTIRAELLLHPDNEDEGETPVWIEYDYSRGYTPGVPPGEYMPIDPPQSAEVSFRSAILTDLAVDDDQPEGLQDKAEQWLLGPGRDYAMRCAETDLLAMRSIHLEDRQ